MKELFTTTDGVKIFVNDQYFSMDIESGEIWFSGAAWKDVSGKNPKLKYFSTYVAAEDYVNKNNTRK